MKKKAKSRTAPFAAAVFAAAGLFVSDKLHGGDIGHVPVYSKCEMTANVATTAAVVFTGERDRLKSGLRLYLDGCVGHIFISGLPGAMKPATLLRKLGLDRHKSRQDDLSRIHIDRTAANTTQNAITTANWLEKMRADGNRIDTLVVVTSDYHMQRSLSDLATKIKDVALYQLPVETDAGVSTYAREGVKRILRGLGFSTDGQIKGF